MLSIVEARVLGCLLEKQRTVPDQYPLTLNALVSACNQSTSREPVMHLSEFDVESAITSLKAGGLARLVHPSHGRSVTRYRQVADEEWQLEPGPAALVAVLLLRGPQTVAELKSRTERQHRFASLDEVQDVLDDLAGRGVVRLLSRRPGQKEPRWQQLLADESAAASDHEEPDGALAYDLPAQVVAPPAPPAVAPVASADPAGEARPSPLAERVAELEERVARLEAALADLL